MAVAKRASKQQQQKSNGGITATDYKDGASDEFEFGGSFGAASLMIGFPLLMWYMWIGATYYDGHLPLPLEGQSWTDFGQHLCSLVYQGAYPTAKAWTIYWVFFIFEAIMYCYMPGVMSYGR
jgi:delta24(24(1))-sterol reductase